MQSPKYSVVIPTYNHCDDFLKPCIESIIKYTNLKDIELIISYNGCTDETKYYINYLIHWFDIRGLGHRLKFCGKEAPSGYAKATNDGIRMASADKIILLNNDIVLLEQRKNYWLELLEAPFNASDDCGISCIIKEWSEPANHHFAVFFCVMVDRKVFNKIGLLNEDYGVGGGEDTEFCIEAERAGFKVCEVLDKHWGGDLYTGGFPIYHKGEGTVHDINLVQNWRKTFADNSLRLAYKYGDKEAKDSLVWLCDNGPEAKELYDEVIAGNIYGVTGYSLKGREVLDIGANMGTFALFASKLGAAEVIAVEPVSATVDIFASNVKRAGINNIVIKQNIVSDQSGKTVRMALHDKSGHNSAYNESDVYEEIETTTLKDLMRLTDGNDVFLKMDCEGGEYDILLNADQSDMDRISAIAIEIHGDLHPKYRDIGLIHTALDRFGYKPISQKRIYAWDLDQHGNPVNHRELPLTQEIWVR